MELTAQTTIAPCFSYHSHRALLSAGLCMPLLLSHRTLWDIIVTKGQCLIKLVIATCSLRTLNEAKSLSSPSSFPFFFTRSSPSLPFLSLSSFSCPSPNTFPLLQTLRITAYSDSRVAWSDKPPIVVVADIFPGGRMPTLWKTGYLFSVALIIILPTYIVKGHTFTSTTKSWRGTLICTGMPAW